MAGLVGEGSEFTTTVKMYFHTRIGEKRSAEKLMTNLSFVMLKIDKLKNILKTLTHFATLADPIYVFQLSYLA